MTPGVSSASCTKDRPFKGNSTTCWLLITVPTVASSVCSPTALISTCICCVIAPTWSCTLTRASWSRLRLKAVTCVFWKPVASTESV